MVLPIGLPSLNKEFTYLLTYLLTSSFEKVRESRVSKDFLKFIYLISIDFRITNTLLQTFLQTDLIHVFFDQFIVSMVKFGKCFAGFMIPIAGLYWIGGYECVTASEIANMRRCYGKAKNRDIETP